METFSEVAQAVGLALYADVAKAIESKENATDRKIDFYVSHRLAEPMRRVWKEIQEAKTEPKWLEQFKLVRQEIQLHRTAEENWMNNEAFLLLPDQMSPVHVEGGQVVFFYLEKRVEEEPVLVKIEGAKALIANRTENFLTRLLLDRIQKKNAVVIPMQKEGDHV